MKNLKLTKEIVETYAPFVRITTETKPNVGFIRVSNSNNRWRASSEDFEYLFGLSIVMMAYSADVVNKIKEKRGFKEPYFNFTFEGYSPIELVQLVESTVNRKIPKGGRPSPKFANFSGKLIEEEFKPRKASASKTKNSEETSSVETPKKEKKIKPKSKVSKGKVEENDTTKADELKDSPLVEQDGGIDKNPIVTPNSESEVSGVESDRFPDSTSTLETEHLEVKNSEVEDTEVSDVNVEELLTTLDNLHDELDTLSKELEDHKSKIEVLAKENQQLKDKVDTALKGVFSALRYTLKESFSRLFGRKSK